MEQVHLNRKDGIAKVLGTLASVAGALVITLYKGPAVYSPNSPSNKLDFYSFGDAKGKNWTVGCICLIGHSLCWSSWIVLQAPVLKKYPARLSFVSYACLFAVLQFGAIAACIERDPRSWQVHSGGEVFTVFYAVGNLLFVEFTISFPENDKKSLMGAGPGSFSNGVCNTNIRR